MSVQPAVQYTAARHCCVHMRWVSVGQVDQDQALNPDQVNPNMRQTKEEA